MDIAEGFPGAGIGWGFNKFYSGILPGKESIYISALGIGFNTGASWFDLGMEPAAIPDNETNFTSLKAIQLYQKNKLTQTLWGDRYHEPFCVDASVGIYSLFFLPMDFMEPGKSFFQSGTILGEQICFPLEFFAGINADFFIDNPVWTTSGFRVAEKSVWHWGAELVPAFWSYLSNRLSFEGFIPITGQLLFLNLITTLTGVSAGLEGSGTLPFFGYPTLIVPANEEITYRDYWSWNIRLDLKSRFLIIDPFFPMALGAGTYVFAGKVAPGFGKLFAPGLKLSLGFYGEYRVEIPHFFSTGIRLGVGFVKDAYKDYDYTPRFLFELFF